MRLKTIVYLTLGLALLMAFASALALDIITDKMEDENARAERAARSYTLSQLLTQNLTQSIRLNGIWFISRRREFLENREIARGETFGSLALLESSLKGSKLEPLVMEARKATEDLYAAQDRLIAQTPGTPLPGVVTRLYRLGTGALVSISKLSKAAAADLAASHEVSGRYAKLSDWLAGGAEVLSVALMLLIAWILHGTVFAPIQHLTEVISATRSGKKGVRIDTKKMRFAEARSAGEGFNELADWLEDTERRKMEYLGSIAHDIRNPLTATKAVVEVLQREPRRFQDPKSQELLALIDTQAEKIGRLVTDWMDVQRIERGELRLQLALVDLRDIASEGVRLWRSTTARHDIVLLAPTHPVLVSCDRDRMTQVLNNLLSNAIKYSPAGGTIEVRVEKRGAVDVLSVKDHGLGISPADMEQLFQPFRRSKQVRNVIPGLGLGLSSAKKIVEAHGGEIIVESELGVGSVFRVRLPAATNARQAA